MLVISCNTFWILNPFIKLFLRTTKINLKFILYRVNIWLMSVIYQDCLHRVNISFTAKFEVGIDVLYSSRFPKLSELGSQAMILAGTGFLKQHTCSAQSTCTLLVIPKIHTQFSTEFQPVSNDYKLTKFISIK